MESLYLIDITNMINVSGLCRLCLLEREGMTSIYNSTEDFNEKTATILQELQKFSEIELSQDPTYPSFICAACVSLLKVSLRIRLQMKLSQEQLARYFRVRGERAKSVGKEKSVAETAEENTVIESVPQTTKVPPVELISSKGKFNLEELIIVEDKPKEEKSKKCYEGFLRNLGSIISAKYVNKSSCNKENMLEEPVVNIIPLKEDEKVTENIDDPPDINTNIKTPPKTKKRRVMVPRRSVRKRSQFPSNSFLCPVCGFVAKNRYQHAYHLSSRHSNKIYSCDLCDKSFSMSYHLKRHLTTHKLSNDENVQKKSQSPTETSLCQICGFVVKKREHLHYHMATKHSTETYKCELCNKVYRTQHRLKQHKVIHRNERPYLCTVCGDSFNYNSSLEYHMRTHTGEKSYKCTYCSKAFGMSWSLKRHLTIHTGARPYQCRHCDKGFSSKGDLKCHVFLHTGERPHGCQHCNKGFTKNYKLRLHMLSHKGPVKCGFCRRCFLDQSLLKLHYKVSHDLPKTGADQNETEDEETKAEQDKLYIEQENPEIGLQEEEVHIEDEPDV